MKRAKEGLSAGSVKRERRLIEKDMAAISVMPITEVTASLLLSALRKLGDPYTDEQIAQAAAEVEGKTELDAVVAYLQALGRHAPRGGQP